MNHLPALIVLPPSFSEAAGVWRRSLRGRWLSVHWLEVALAKSEAICQEWLKAEQQKKQSFKNQFQPNLWIKLCFCAEIVEVGSPSTHSSADAPLFIHPLYSHEVKKAFIGRKNVYMSPSAGWVINIFSDFPVKNAEVELKIPSKRLFCHCWAWYKCTGEFWSELHCLWH